MEVGSRNISYDERNLQDIGTNGQEIYDNLLLFHNSAVQDGATCSESLAAFCTRYSDIHWHAKDVTDDIRDICGELPLSILNSVRDGGAADDIDIRSWLQKTYPCARFNNKSIFLPATSSNLLRMEAT